MCLCPSEVPMCSGWHWLCIPATAMGFKLFGSRRFLGMAQAGFELLNCLGLHPGLNTLPDGSPQQASSGGVGPCGSARVCCPVREFIGVCSTCEPAPELLPGLPAMPRSLSRAEPRSLSCECHFPCAVAFLAKTQRHASALDEGERRRVVQHL